jgi:peptidoglycan hydrolase-like protein with peptidoglycan-binding domain
MKKIITKKMFLYSGMTALVALGLLLGGHAVEAVITSSLDIGSRGPDVTELQTYYSTDTSIYPSKLITGYFGPLTAEATRRFQSAQGIVTSGTPATTGYGRVGPITRARINLLMGGNVGVSTKSAPSLSAPSVSVTNNSATISWTTNVPSQGQVFYDTAQIVSNEATGPRQQPYVSGMFSTGNAGQTNHSITLQNLSSGTTYYFLTRATDSIGNMSMTLQNSFTTNN